MLEAMPPQYIHFIGGTLIIRTEADIVIQLIQLWQTGISSLQTLFLLIIFYFEVLTSHLEAFTKIIMNRRIEINAETS